MRLITSGAPSCREAVLPENQPLRYIHEASSRPEARHWRILQWPQGGLRAMDGLFHGPSEGRVDDGDPDFHSEGLRDAVERLDRGIRVRIGFESRESRPIDSAQPLHVRQAQAAFLTLGL